MRKSGNNKKTVKYVPVLIVGQNFELQFNNLKTCGCMKLFIGKIKGIRSSIPGLKVLDRNEELKCAA